MNITLNLDAKTGKFFEKSKTPIDGYERTITNHPVTKDEIITYRKSYPNGAFGTLEAFDITSFTHEGRTIKNLRIVLKEGENVYFLTMPLVNQKSNIQDYAATAIAYLPHLVKGESYNVFPFAIKDKETGRTNYGTSIRYARLITSPEGTNAVDKENKISKLSFQRNKKNEDGTSSVTPGDVPVDYWKKVGDDWRRNTDDRDAFLLEVVSNHMVAFSGTGNQVETFDSKKDPSTVSPEKSTEASVTKTTPSSTEETAKESAVEVQDVDVEDIEGEDDDLPF